MDNKGGFSFHPTLKVPIYPPNSGLRFQAPHNLITQHHILVDNFWASKNNPNHFLYTIQTLDKPFLTTNDQAIENPLLHFSPVKSQKLTLNTLCPNNRKSKSRKQKLNVERNKNKKWKKNWKSWNKNIKNSWNMLKKIKYQEKNNGWVF